MINSLDLNEQNKVTVMLMQALLGAVSLNFRRVSLSMTAPVMHISFILEEDNFEDRELIQEIVDDFDGLTHGFFPNLEAVLTEVTVSNNPQSKLDPNVWRTVYSRREVNASINH